MSFSQSDIHLYLGQGNKIHFSKPETVYAFENENLYPSCLWHEK